MRSRQSWLVALLVTISCCHGSRRRICRVPYVNPSLCLSGGGQEEVSEDENVTTVEAYVAAMEEQDKAAQDRDDEVSSSSTPSKQAAKPQKSPLPEDAPVGVKQHHKKSNAVGDPDGNSSDDDTDEDSSEWEEFLEEMHEELGLDTKEVEVEMELLKEETASTPPSMGGLGVKLASRLSPRQNAKGQNKRKDKNVKSSMQEAWMAHVYLPPPVEYLEKHARSIDSDAKYRLDRRTLYGSLLLEWQHKSASSRKFLDAPTSQALQASLSLATQPKWRKSFPQASVIAFHEEESTATTTLAMQETIAMALAHSLGCGMVIIDDAVLNSVRQDLGKDDDKPAHLIKALLSLAREGKLSSTKNSALISSCMDLELNMGLEDPFDERAVSSCQEMKHWENSSKESHGEESLPLVLFVRTESATSLLKSKSAVEHLVQEATSSDSNNLIVLGKGIDVTTETLPAEESVPEMRMTEPPSRDGPLFRFSPQNQNASGQNDPEGSRRFNIFLARTTDKDGTPGILGAIAPPQVGNLFPHMMAIQARDRLQQKQQEGGEGGADDLQQLEHMSNMLQQQMAQQQHSPSNPFSSPQFFNATFVPPDNNENNNFMPNQQQLPQEEVQKALQHSMSELLDRLAEMNEEQEEGTDLHPDLHRAFGQVLRNENLRRGIADNLARAAPALTDPKCQGVMLSVYVPPPQHHVNHGKLPGPQQQGMLPAPEPQQQQQALPPQKQGGGGWFHKILNNDHNTNEESDELEDADEEEDWRSKKRSRKSRNRPVADSDDAQKVERNLQKLSILCRHVAVKAPTDPVRRKSWLSWISRERGAVVFRQNRRALHGELAHRRLVLEDRTGTRGIGSSLRQMLSVRNVSDEMQNVIKCAVELEAAKSQRLFGKTLSISEESNSEIDVSMHQLLVNDDGETTVEPTDKNKVEHLHPSSLESALALVCRLNPSPSGGLSLSSSTTPPSHRSKEDVLALAQDKHERALVSQVVSPQDIGVTYDMIGGLTNVKELLRQSITYPLKFPHLYSEGIAREAVKGVLLFGPPGTGKTMLAKAVATEGGASFLSVDASSVENKWLGESEKNAKAVFTLARRLAPCVVFIDEVDSLLSSREGSSDDSAHGTLTSVKTTMMSEWDGLNSGTNGNGEAGSDRVVVIGSTNRPFDLDEAVLRRFPRRILVDLPDLETRHEILQVTLAENRLDPSVNLTEIAARLEGYTGSDIKEVCREAVVQISHEQAKLADQGDSSFSETQRLRPVNSTDFDLALGKLKKSVSERGKELGRVWEWNDEYGEIKRESRDHLPQLMNMFL